MFSEFEDLFEEFFGLGPEGGRRSRYHEAEPGADLHQELEIGFLEAVTGKKARIAINRLENCPSCSGWGVVQSAQPYLCPSCRGVGFVRAQSGFSTLTRPCPQCQGMGRLAAQACRRCFGAGRIRKERSVEFEIPPGVSTGTRLTLAGAGHAGPRGGVSGDLHITLSVRDHEVFDRQGNDLYCTIPLSFPQAALGTEIVVPTLRGEERLAIPEGTQNGCVFRLEGKGIEGQGKKGAGDLFVTVRIVTPSSLSERQRRLLERFDEIAGPES